MERGWNDLRVFLNEQTCIWNMLFHLDHIYICQHQTNKRPSAKYFTAWVPCEKLSRATFIPSRIICLSMSTLWQTGPETNMTKVHNKRLYISCFSSSSPDFTITSLVMMGLFIKKIHPERLGGSREMNAYFLALQPKLNHWDRARTGTSATWGSRSTMSAQCSFEHKIINTTETVTISAGSLTNGADDSGHPNNVWFRVYVQLTHVMELRCGPGGLLLLTLRHLKETTER